MTLVSIVFKAVSHFLCQKYFSSKVIVPMSLCLPCQVLCLLDTSVHGKQTVYCNFFCTANYTLYKSPLVSSHFIPLKPLTPAYLSVLICSVAVFLLQICLPRDVTCRCLLLSSCFTDLAAKHHIIDFLCYSLC